MSAASADFPNPRAVGSLVARTIQLKLRQSKRGDEDITGNESSLQRHSTALRSGRRMRKTHVRVSVGRVAFPDGGPSLLHRRSKNECGLLGRWLNQDKGKIVNKLTLLTTRS
jgi:hypothetical protein